MVEVIRNKWCEDLEDLLQCPICMIRPKSWIYQCIQGHHICMDCKTQLSMCPTCSQRWSHARNRLAESLCSKLDDIKLSLIDPESEINKLLIPDRVSVSSQTDAVNVAEVTGVPAKKATDEHTGPYPCRIGGCNVNLYYAPLMNHIKNDHRSQYMELPAGDGAVFQHMWFFDFAELMVFDRAFVIPNKGTFFLKLSSDCFGNLNGFVLMLHNGFIAKQFTYQLEISCCADHTTGKSYTGEICSCRTPVAVLNEKCLQIKRAEIQRMLDHQRNLTCTVLVGKKPQTEDQDAPPKPNNQRKRFPNKKNNAGKSQQTNQQNAPGPSTYRPPMMNRQHRPQTAPNAQQGQGGQGQGHQGQGYQGQGRQGLGYQGQGHQGSGQGHQGLADLHIGPNRHFGNNRNPPSRAGSIPSLLYPDLRNIL